MTSELFWSCLAKHTFKWLIKSARTLRAWVIEFLAFSFVLFCGDCALRQIKRWEGEK